ncbi:chromosome segregation protein ScpA [Suicoccus acidiformans]|uniref:Segregation and condensation protein A n=1 Tax=Suicoccus acidiformans TaxID=2036206 RepID=A0A347WL96_9LACT|nr:segregation/condensation protein A [Suicoccus acidiformans]AXY25853.1 chromosome segregation protein ScpA [Suicoccus acidiformans]
MSELFADELHLELEVFTGPFDLLLHLIRKLEVDINDIPMTEITEQYLAYVHSMQEVQLDVVGDYLVMAATLLEIKSRLLLPIEPDDELDDPYEGEDPRAALVQQLLLYQQFQDVASQLQKQEADRGRAYDRPLADLSAHIAEVKLKAGAYTVEDLAISMEDVLKRAQDREPKLREIQGDPVTVDEKIESMQNYFQLHPHTEVAFLEFVEEETPSQIISAFLAMLELVRKQWIVFQQEVPTGPITLKGSEVAHASHSITY